MAYQQTYNFPAAIRGDTYNDVEFIVNSKVGSVITPKNLTGCIIRMWVVNKQTKATAMDLTTTNGKIVITDAVAGKFKVVIGVVSIPIDTYNYDIEITFTTGVVKTWIKGAFFVTNDITK